MHFVADLIVNEYDLRQTLCTDLFRENISLQLVALRHGKTFSNVVGCCPIQCTCSYIGS